MVCSHTHGKNLRDSPPGRMQFEALKAKRELHLRKEKEKRKLDIAAEEARKAGLEPEGRVQEENVQSGEVQSRESLEDNEQKDEKPAGVVEEPKEGVVCG